MSDYLAEIVWQLADNDDFSGNKYSRGHRWHFDGGTVVEASASPHIVPVPYALPESVDPEEAFVAALSSCHMLFFLALASKKRLLVTRYRDKAVGTLAADDDGVQRMTEVRLCPVVEFAGEAPSLKQIEATHHKAHELCFIANSVTSKVWVDLSAQQALA